MAKCMCEETQPSLKPTYLKCFALSLLRNILVTAFTQVCETQTSRTDPMILCVGVYVYIYTYILLRKAVC